MASPIIGLYQACGTIGNVGTPGAPIVHFSLLVYPSGNHVTGVVHITQAIAGPNSDLEVNVTGTIHHTGLGNVAQVVSLQGEYVQCVPPPAIGCFLAKFNAHMAIDNAWDGTGGFTYGNNKPIENVPVKNEKCS